MRAINAIVTRRLIDPIHFFDERGHSTMSTDYLKSRLKELEADNERLRRLLQAQVRRAKTAEAEEESRH